jgi:hypothetical protein
MRTKSDFSAGERFSAFPAHQRDRIVCKPAPPPHLPIAAARGNEYPQRSRRRIESLPLFEWLWRDRMPRMDPAVFGCRHRAKAGGAEEALG